MNRPVAALLALLSSAAPAVAAERSYTVTGFEQIRVNGPYKVRLTTGVPPFARATGSASAIDGVAIDVNGRILTVRRNPSAPSSDPSQQAGPVEIELGTHELSSAAIVGSGSLDISRAKGLAFSLTVEGAGAARIASVAVDQLKVWVAGTGSAALAGEAKSGTFLVRGISSLDATGLAVRDAVIGTEGPSNVRLTVANSAKVDAKGVSQVALEGGPSCSVTAAGSATVTGCKPR